MEQPGLAGRSRHGQSSLCCSPTGGRLRKHMANSSLGGKRRVLHSLEAASSEAGMFDKNMKVGVSVLGGRWPLGGRPIWGSGEWTEGPSEVLHWGSGDLGPA